jgi:hypothetical protein
VTAAAAVDGKVGGAETSKPSPLAGTTAENIAPSAAEGASTKVDLSNKSSLSAFGLAGFGFSFRSTMPKLPSFRIQVSIHFNTLT